MSEVKLHIFSAVFENLPSSEDAYNQISGRAKIVNLFAPSENQGFGICLYERTVLTPSSRAVQKDGILLSFTPPHSSYINESLRKNYLSSRGLPLDIFNEAVTRNANHPPAIVDSQGFVHLLQLRRSQGYGYVWYLLNSNSRFKAA